MAKPKASVKEKVQKNYPEFVTEVESLAIKDLEQKLSNYAKKQEEVSDSKEADEELSRTRELLTELSGPYKDASTAIRLKMRYIISLIREKGGDA